MPELLISRADTITGSSCGTILRIAGHQKWEDMHVTHISTGSTDLLDMDILISDDLLCVTMFS